MDPQLIERGLPRAELTAEQRLQLDEQGYAILPTIIDTAWLRRLRQAFDDIYDTEGEEAGKEAGQIDGVRRLSDLVNKGEVFDGIYQHPLLLAAVWHVLQRPFKLHSVNGHDPLPGRGQQQLHPDWGGSRGQGIYHVVNSMWMLDDMRVDNGATRLVLGSHLNPASIADSIENRTAPHPDEIYLTATDRSACPSAARDGGSIVTPGALHTGCIERTGRPSLHSESKQHDCNNRLPGH